MIPKEYVKNFLILFYGGICREGYFRLQKVLIIKEKTALQVSPLDIKRDHNIKWKEEPQVVRRYLQPMEQWFLATMYKELLQIDKKQTNHQSRKWTERGGETASERIIHIIHKQTTSSNLSEDTPGRRAWEPHLPAWKWIQGRDGWDYFFLAWGSESQPSPAQRENVRWKTKLPPCPAPACVLSRLASSGLLSFPVMQSCQQHRAGNILVNWYSPGQAPPVCGYRLSALRSWFPFFFFFPTGLIHFIFLV